MIIIDHFVLDDELFDEYFACDLNACKGACCVEGASGAPLEKEEADELRKHIHKILPYVDEAGKESISKYGVAVRDEDGELVTPLVSKNGACAYAIKNEKGITVCAIEKLHKEKIIPVQKPVSCHLYPIRVEKKGGKEFLHYHRWNICKPACKCGKNLKMPLVSFLKNALIRKYGRTFYQQIEQILEYRKKSIKK